MRKFKDTDQPAWVLVVKENTSVYERKVLDATRAFSSSHIHNLLWRRATEEDVERMYVVCLDGNNGIKCLSEVARGGLHGCSVSPRDILRIGLIAGASGIILVHNHPSGNPTPSAEDIAMTKLVQAAAEVVGLALLDHVIIASSTKYSSMLDLGVM